jgi:hypothetical protein
LEGRRESGCLGLALLVRQGIGAWIRAWSSLSPVVPKLGAPSAHTECLVDELRGEVAVVLAEMALSAIRGVA